MNDRAPDHSFVVPPELAAKPLDGVVRAALTLPWSKARELVATGKVFIRGAAVTDPTRKIRAGEEVSVHMRAPRPETARALAALPTLCVYLDATLVVVRKPAGISTVPFGDEDPGAQTETLDALVRDVLARRDKIRGRAPLGVVQRLDKPTSGLLVFARTLAAKKHLGQQLREHTVHRVYQALVHGTVGAQTIRTHLLDDRGDHLRGSAERLSQRLGKPIRGGQLAITHVTPIEKLDGATLVACRLETGRTHQIRIHLSECGHPLLGEDVYVRDYAGPLIPAPRLMLHAAELGFLHPLDERPMHFVEPPPDDFVATMKRLGLGKKSSRAAEKPRR